MGEAHDSQRQYEVLWAALQAAAAMETPGQVVHLPHQWHESRTLAIKNSTPDMPPPIVGYLKRSPWQMSRFLRGKIPGP